MKKTVLLLSAIASFVMAHENHGPQSVTSTESLLWVREELKLDANQYKIMSEKIKTYRSSQTQCAISALKDSISLELTRPSPSEKKIDQWTKETGSAAQKKVAGYTSHIKEIKNLLTPEQFTAFIGFADKIYPAFGAKHEHAHTHTDGTTHTHDHDHGIQDTEHTHSHDSTAVVHEHAHTHTDGTTHTHGHDHDALNKEHSHTH